MDRKKRNSLIAIIISLVLFAGIVLILVFFGSKSSGRVGPVARYNIVTIIVAVLIALGLGISHVKRREFQIDRRAVLGLFMLAFFSFIGLMIWLSSNISLSIRITGTMVMLVIALPLLFWGVKLRRHAQTQQLFSWATVVVWMGSIASVFSVAGLIQVLILLNNQ